MPEPVEGWFLRKGKYIQYLPDESNAADVIARAEEYYNEAQNGLTFVSATIHLGHKIKITNDTYNEILDPGDYLVLQSTEMSGLQVVKYIPTGTNSREAVWSRPEEFLPTLRMQSKVAFTDPMAEDATDTIMVTLDQAFASDSYGASAVVFVDGDPGIILVDEVRVVDENSVEVDVRNTGDLATGTIVVSATGY